MVNGFFLSYWDLGLTELGVSRVGYRSSTELGFS